MLLDITPKALEYTVQNLKEANTADGIADTILGKIERLDSRLGPFKAVVGMYAFSLIPPDEFFDVIEENILNRIVPNGYFAGGFFGKEHAWAAKPNLTILTKREVENFFTSRGFSIRELSEKKENTNTVMSKPKFFHTINVIAQKIP